MLVWLPLLLLSSATPAACVPDDVDRSRSEIAAPASFASFMAQLESIDIDSRVSVTNVLGAALTRSERTDFHQMWDGTAVGPAPGPNLRIDYREGIPGTTGKSMLVIDILTPQYTLEAARARYPQMRLTGIPTHDCPLDRWSYEVPDREPRLLLSFDQSNSFLRTVIFRSQ